MRRLLPSLAPVILASAVLVTSCGGSEGPQLVKVEPGDGTPTSLAFAVETSEPMSRAAADEALYACSDAIVAFLEVNPYETPEEIEVIKAALMSGENDVGESCASLKDPEALGLTEEHLIGHMMSEMPPDALGVLVQLSDALMG